MAHVDQKPMVKENIQDTLGELVNSMLYLVDSMPNMVKTGEDDEHTVVISKPHFNGFMNQLDVIRDAAETAYSQCGEQYHTYNTKIVQLEQKLKQAKELNESEH